MSSLLRLSAYSAVIKSAHEELSGVIARLDIPTVEQIHIRVFWHIKEAIVVVVEFQGHVLCVKQDTCGHFVVQVPTARSIDLSMSLGANHRIESNGVLRLWFEVLHVDLSCDSLIAIEDGGGAFAHLNGFHPWTRYILHAKRLCQSADIRGILGEHLYIGAAKS